MPSAHMRQLLEEAKSLEIAGTAEMNIAQVSRAIRRKRAELAETNLAKSSQPTPAVLGCSACGGTEEHHLAYVRSHGLCVS